MLSRTSRNNKESKIFNAEITSHINLTESNYFVSDFRTEQFNDETTPGNILQTLLGHI